MACVILRRRCCLRRRRQCRAGRYAPQNETASPKLSIGHSGQIDRSRRFDHQETSEHHGVQETVRAGDALIVWLCSNEYIQIIIIRIVEYPKFLEFFEYSFEYEHRKRAIFEYYSKIKYSNFIRISTILQRQKLIRIKLEYLKMEF